VFDEKGLDGLISSSGGIFDVEVPPKRLLLGVVESFDEKCFFFCSFSFEDLVPPKGFEGFVFTVVSNGFFFFTLFAAANGFVFFIVVPEKGFFFGSSSFVEADVPPKGFLLDAELVLFDVAKGFEGFVLADVSNGFFFSSRFDPNGFNFPVFFANGLLLLCDPAPNGFVDVSSSSFVDSIDVANGLLLAFFFDFPNRFNLLNGFDMIHKKKMVQFLLPSSSFE
jgi:hypothetical protein